MKKLNIRRFATPLIIGAGLISAITGLLMFFTTEQPFLSAHEIVGLGFSVAILLHIYTNWRPFKKYFSQRGVIIALAWLIGIGLIARTAIFSEGEPEKLIMQKIEQTSLTRIAPIVDMDVETLIKRLGDDGYTVDIPEMSIEALAEAHGAETNDVLLSVFRGVASLGTSERVVSLKETVTVDLPRIEFDIHLADGEGVAGYRLTIAYDPFVLDYVATTDGDYLPTSGLFLRPALGADEIYALHLTVDDTTTTRAVCGFR